MFRYVSLEERILSDHPLGLVRVMVDRALTHDVAAVTWMDWSPAGRWLIVDGQGPMVMFEVATGAAASHSLAS